MILALGKLRQEDCSEFQVKSGLQSETLLLKKRGGGLPNHRNKQEKQHYKEVTLGLGL